MRARTIVLAFATIGLFGLAAGASAEESRISVGAIDAVLSVPPDVEKPPVALLIAGSGTTDHDGNGPQIKPATLKKLAEQLVARKIATLRYDKRGAGGWKAEFGRPENFRFKDYVDDAVSLVNYLRSSGKFSKGRSGRTQRGRAGRDPDRAARTRRSPGVAGHRRPPAGRFAQGAARKGAPARKARADRQGDRRHHGRPDRRSAAAGVVDPAVDAARHRFRLHRRPDRALEADRTADDDRRRRSRPAGGAAGFPGAVGCGSGGQDAVARGHESRSGRCHRRR